VSRNVVEKMRIAVDRIHWFDGEAASRALVSVCAGRHLPLHVFPWRQSVEDAGFARNAAYLVRPDGYVGLADPAASASELESYLDARKLRPALA
jgi:hypothetical protein